MAGNNIKKEQTNEEDESSACDRMLECEDELEESEETVKRYFDEKVYDPLPTCEQNLKSTCLHQRKKTKPQMSSKSSQGNVKESGYAPIGQNGTRPVDSRIKKYSSCKTQ